MIFVACHSFSLGIVLSLRMAVAFYVTGISTRSPPRISTTWRDVNDLQRQGIDPSDL
jgi:hypothetical protein